MGGEGWGAYAADERDGARGDDGPGGGAGDQRGEEGAGAGDFDGFGGVVFGEETFHVADV